MTYYSALHYAAKAEKSMNRAEAAATSAANSASQASQASGKIIQLGFDGAIEDGVLVFTHAPSGVEVPYELLDDYEYEVDMLYGSTEELSSDLPMVIKNGANTITFVSALHRSADEPATVGDMKAVMRYNSDTGYRWLFKAAYKVTTSGDKVFLLYPVVASEEVINSKITNCITEIPQDIKLELNNGTLTLKAGSKVYVPNGFEADGTTPKFDEVVVASDIVRTNASGSYIRKVFVNAEGTAIDVFVNSFSGNTAPVLTDLGAAAMWYDTANNVIKKTTDYGATWTSGGSLPIAIMTSTDDVITSIDQVFNGFGYIGHTAWVSKGVKCLLPKGRNEDGSLKNLEYTTKFSFNTVSTTSTSNGIIIINEPEEGEREIYLFWDKAIHVGKNPPGDSLIASVTPYSAMAWFNPDENICRSLEKNSTAPYNWVEESSFVIVGKLFRDTANNNKIKELFITADATNLIKRSDSYEVSGWGMPSDKYIDLELGASGATYTAPANGWFCLIKKSTGGGQSIDMETNGINSQAISTASGQAISAFAPVLKGESVVIYYTTGGATNRFRFIYAKGEE